MSKVKVNLIEAVNATTPAITLDNTNGTCTANLTNRNNRNLIINGAMQVAQRGTSSTAAGYTCDRFNILFSGNDEAPTHAQVDVTSGTTPYTLGFRKALKITNGNQTGGAGSSDYILARYKVEAQDIANSGWNYTSSSSYVTLSFWIKSSVSQNFYFNLRSIDGTSQNYAYETGSLSANTWTKVTKTILGASNIQIDNDNNVGLFIDFWAFAGTAYTDSSVTLNQWAAYSSGNRMPDHTSTWYTTNDATFELTGVQLEVGSVATDFEHKSFNQELALCKRYYQQFPQSPADAYGPIASGRIRNSTNAHLIVFFPEMRSSPTCTKVGNLRILHAATSTGVNSVASSHMARNIIFIEGIVSSGLTQGEGCMMTANNDLSGKITLSAEL